MSRAVIDVSSREHSPVRPARGSKPRTRSKHSVPAEDVIVLTDSDSENVRAGSSQRRATRSTASLQQHKRTRKVQKRVAGQPVAGPSRIRNEEPAPIHAPPPAAVPIPAPAPAPIPAFVHDPIPALQPLPAALPLFLPDPHDNPHDNPAPAPMHPLAHPAAAPPEVPAPQLEPPAPHPVAEQDDVIPFDAYVAQVLEIILDVHPAHVFSLIEQHLPSHKDNVVEQVLHVLFENPDYPKADTKGKDKRKREDDMEEQRVVKPKIDYGDKNRIAGGTIYYSVLALVSSHPISWIEMIGLDVRSQEQLEFDFVDIPALYVRQTFKEQNSLYAPTYLALKKAREQLPLPYKSMARPRNKGKGKKVLQHDEELAKEMQWIQDELDDEEAQHAAEVAEELRLQEEGGIECGCCFSEYPFVRVDLFLRMISARSSRAGQDGAVSGSTFVLHDVYAVVRRDQAWGTRRADRLHGSVRLQAPVPRFRAAPISHPETTRAVRARETAQRDRGCGSRGPRRMSVL